MIHLLCLGILRNCSTLALEAWACSTVPARWDRQQSTLLQAGQVSKGAESSTAWMGEEVGVLLLQLWFLSLTCQQFWRTESGGSRQSPGPGSRQDGNLAASRTATSLLLLHNLRGRDTCCSSQHHTQVSPYSNAPLKANCNYSMCFPIVVTTYTSCRNAQTNDS